MWSYTELHSGNPKLLVEIPCDPGDKGCNEKHYGNNKKIVIHCLSLFMNFYSDCGWICDSENKNDWPGGAFIFTPL